MLKLSMNEQHQLYQAKSIIESCNRRDKQGVEHAGPPRLAHVAHPAGRFTGSRQRRTTCHIATHPIRAVPPPPVPRGLSIRSSEFNATIGPSAAARPASFGESEPCSVILCANAQSWGT
jgi:hypothetical protein